MTASRSALRWSAVLVGLAMAIGATSGGADASAARAETPRRPIAAPGAPAAPGVDSGRHGMGALAPDSTVQGRALPRAQRLPAKVDLSAWTVPVQSQGALGSCVAWSIGYAMMGWYYRHAYGQSVVFAPMYLYSQGHGPVVNGEPGGMLATSALEMLRTQGIDTKDDYGSGWATDYQNPPAQGGPQQQNAAHHRISGYHSLFRHQDLHGAASGEQNQIKAALAGSSPVAIAINLKASVFRHYRHGVYRGLASARHPQLHEMLAVGYNAKGLIAQNSWGTDWGRHGFVTIGWDTVRRNVYEADVIDGLVDPQPTDTAAPTVSAPLSRVVAGTAMSDAGFPVDISWQGADDSGSVAGYALAVSVDGTAWQPESLSTATATDIAFALTPGHTYQFATQAVDAAGNHSAWSYGTAFTVGDYDDDSGYVAYSSGWSRIAWSAADGGTLATTTTAGAYASFTFTGSSVAWVAAQGANRGQANVYVDGTYVTTVDLYAASPVARYVAVQGNWGQDTTHTLVVQAVGTAGRPAIDVDSFVVLY